MYILYTTEPIYDLLAIGPIEKNTEIWVTLGEYLCKDMHMEMADAKCYLFCYGLSHLYHGMFPCI